MAWVPHEGRPIVFTKATNKWSHAELSYTQVGWDGWDGGMVDDGGVTVKRFTKPKIWGTVGGVNG